MAPTSVAKRSPITCGSLWRLTASRSWLADCSASRVASLARDLNPVQQTAQFESPPSYRVAYCWSGSESTETGKQSASSVGPPPAQCRILVLCLLLSLSDKIRRRLGGCSWVQKLEGLCKEWEPDQPTGHKAHWAQQ